MHRQQFIIKINFKKKGLVPTRQSRLMNTAVWTVASEMPFIWIMSSNDSLRLPFPTTSPFATAAAGVGNASTNSRTSLSVYRHRNTPNNN